MLCDGVCYMPEQPKALFQAVFGHKKSTVILIELRWIYGGEEGIRTH